jgi:hypothetical protein
MKLIFLLLTFLDVTGTNITKDTTRTNGVYLTGVTGLNASQVSFTNWSQGGENSITWSVFGDFGVKFVQDSLLIYNHLNVVYGKTKTGDAIFKTNSNEIFFETIFLYRMGWQIDPYFSNTVRTVITKGYDYSKEPPVKISDFFDPGYVTQSIGFSYNKSKGFNTRLGIALQEVFTNKFRNYSDKAATKTKVEAFKLETGVESVSEAKYEIMENITYSSRLRLFTRFEHIDVWDIRWDNTLKAKINSLFNVNLSTLLVYEKAQSYKTQFREALQLGVTFNIF